MLTGQRGIDVLIEVDMPGHTASLAYSHPEHIACFGKYWDKYAAKPPAGQMRYANEETEDFMKGYVSELVEIVHGRYVGTGGDEPSQRCMVGLPLLRLASLVSPSGTDNAG